MRQQTRLISGIIDPLPPTLPPTRSEAAAAERAHFVEKAKDRWNAEIEGAVHWVQNKDWDEVREGVEMALARLWARSFGDPQAQAEKGEEVASRVSADANTKLGQGKEKVASVAAAAKNAYADAKAKGSEVAARTEEKAEEARGSIFSSIASGFRKGKEAAENATSAVLKGAEQKVEELPSGLTEEERALNQRYQGSNGFDKSAEEVLAARYAPTTARS